MESGRPIQGAIANANAGNLRAQTCGMLFMLASDRLRRDIRFPKLCVAFGLVDYWSESGLWPDCVNEVASYYDFKAECKKAAQEAAQS